jgi:hypothetical protein
MLFIPFSKDEDEDDDEDDDCCLQENRRLAMAETLPLKP